MALVTLSSLLRSDNSCGIQLEQTCRRFNWLRKIVRTNSWFIPVMLSISRTDNRELSLIKLLIIPTLSTVETVIGRPMFNDDDAEEEEEAMEEDVTDAVELLAAMR